MKRLLTLLFLGLFGAGLMVGCEASGRVGDEDDGDATYRKTTTVKDADDDDYKRTETKTEIRRD